MNLLGFVFSLFIIGVSSKCQRCFGEDFMWGAATSAHQIEGAWNTSGKGENVWDWFTHNYPEKVRNGSNADIATDSYNKYQEDVDLLGNLGANFYRFSLSWSRILPNGTTNNINQEGVDYYLNVLKALQEKNITPIVTLYHWDLPISLHEMGGWNNPLVADYFNDYATLCYSLFGDYVKYWLTLNEPISQCYYGYGSGGHAPGYTESGTMTYMCAYTQLLAHAKAYRSYNETFRAKQNGKVGIVLVTLWYEPATESDADKQAAEWAIQWALGLFGHPIFIGNWPQMVIDRIGNLSVAQGFNTSRLPAFTETEIELIKGTYDYLGLNYYTTLLASPLLDFTDYENVTVGYGYDRNVLSSYDPSWTQSPVSWVTLFDVPAGFRAMLNWVANNFGNPPVIITENGWSTYIDLLNDTDRIQYIKGHLCSIYKAKYVDKVNLFGYAHWSLMDNFEWSSGYSEGFGLVSVDFTSPNRTRTPKASYYYYQKIIKSNCLEHCSLNN
ncbi:myrosinase 1-like [Anthonomus grandis grandis]|uniref:myrosinase 1-like n=1 Tax=Anthonomus grandis grandis TaxID=2921223 RepID=UPI0021664AFF|nr:myrosinase 1-like [Anthonomus grandis grandis]